MASPRGILVAVALLLCLLVGALAWIARPEEARAAPSDAGAEGSPADEVRIERPEERIREVESPVGTNDPRALPEALAAAFEKRYRGFAPETLAIAHGRLVEKLRVRRDEILRSRLKSASPGAAAPEIDLSQEASTRDLCHEIAWLASRLPAKE